MSEPTTDSLGESVSPAALFDRLARGEHVTIVDTRDRDEFEAWHVDGPAARAVQVPHLQFLQADATGDVDALVEKYELSGPVVAVCAEGKASDHAAALLRGAGLEAANLDGGMEAWARAYLATDLATDGEVTVRQYVRPSSGCLAYLVADAGEAVVVDPLRAFADRYVEDARRDGLEVVAVVDTHVHADHLSGLRDVAAETGAAPVVPEAALDRGLAFDADLLGDGDRLPVGEASVEALHVPGHTTEMTALRVEETFLSGDSLFLESVARPDLEAGDEGAPALAAQLHESLHDRILGLPDETVVAPGHVGPRTQPDEGGAYAATLGECRAEVALLGLGRSVFVERVLEDMPPRPANFERIIAANLGQEAIEAEEGFELELGPNNCAVSA